MIVDRDGGRSPGELRGEKAVGRVEAPLIHLGPWEPRRLRRREGRRLATEAPAFLAPVVAEVVVERVDVAPALLAEVVREIGVAPPVARGALGVRVLVPGVARARAIELPLAPALGDAFLLSHAPTRWSVGHATCPYLARGRRASWTLYFAVSAAVRGAASQPKRLPSSRPWSWKCRWSAWALHSSLQKAYSRSG